MPPYRTRDTARSLEVTVVDALEASAAPTLNIISPTPRAPTFSFAPNSPHHTPSLSPTNSPFEPDLRAHTLTPPALTSSPVSSFLPSEPSAAESSALASPTPTLSAVTSSPARTAHRRRRSAATEINERRPKKGDDDYIKRPENAFILFRRKCVEDRNSTPGVAVAEVESGATQPKRQRQADLSKAISAQWKALSAEEKQHWEDLAKERKEAHAKQYPNYVYRPVRVKKGKVAASASSAGSSAKGKGKATMSAEDELSTDGDLTFTMPVLVTPVYNGRRVGPTPPPMHQQIIVPSLPNLTLTPLAQQSQSLDSPVEVASIAGRRASDVSDVSDAEMDGWTMTFGEFTGPEGWHPQSNPIDSIFEPFAIPHAPTMFNGDGCPPLPLPLSVQTDPLCLPPAAFENPSLTSSSSASSPHLGPFTPGTLETVTVTAAPDMWQSLSLDITEPPRHAEPAFTYAYQPYSWEPGVWQQGCAPLFNEDFDVNLIPPVTLSVPKFDSCAGADQCPPPAAIDIPLYGDACPTAKMAAPSDNCDAPHQRDTFMHAFHFDEALDLARRVEY